MDTKKIIFFDFDGTLTYDTPNPYETLLQNTKHSYKKARKEKAKRFGSKNSLILSNEKESFLKSKKVVKKPTKETVSESKPYSRLFAFSKDLYCKSFLHKVLSPKLVLSCFGKLFRMSDINKNDLQYLANHVNIMDNIVLTLSWLKAQGCKLYIVSGGLKPIIYDALKEKVTFFEGISASDVEFDKNGKIKKITSQNYDLEGKAEYIKKVLQENKLSPKDAIFVGNDANDVFVKQMGCKTLCVNPEPGALKKGNAWDCVINNTTNAEDILFAIDGIMKEQEYSMTK